MSRRSLFISAVTLTAPESTTALKISNGKWCWFSRGIGGYSALDYLIKGQRNALYAGGGNDYGNVAVLPADLFPRAESRKKSFAFAKTNRCRPRRGISAWAGIDYELIDFCISTGRLYESYPHYNAVFVGQDLDGKPRYANLRGIGTDFIGDANGSDKRYSFGIPAAVRKRHAESV